VPYPKNRENLNKMEFNDVRARAAASAAESAGNNGFPLGGPFFLIIRCRQVKMYIQVYSPGIPHDSYDPGHRMIDLCVE
jgi:hypothetical protein